MRAQCCGVRYILWARSVSLLPGRWEVFFRVGHITNVCRVQGAVVIGTRLFLLGFVTSPPFGGYFCGQCPLTMRA